MFAANLQIWLCAVCLLCHAPLCLRDLKKTRIFYDRLLPTVGLVSIQGFVEIEILISIVWARTFGGCSRISQTHSPRSLKKSWKILVRFVIPNILVVLLQFEQQKFVGIYLFFQLTCLPFVVLSYWLSEKGQKNLLSLIEKWVLWKNVLFLEFIVGC